MRRRRRRREKNTNLFGLVGEIIEIGVGVFFFFFFITKDMNTVYGDRGYQKRQLLLSMNDGGEQRSVYIWK